MHGDCLERMKEIPDDSVDMVLADPPYGTTQCKWDSIIDLTLMWEQLKRVIKPNGAIVLMGQTPFDKVLGSSNLKMLRYEWIWSKPQGTGHLNAKKMPLKSTENALVFYNTQPVYNPQMRTGFKPYTCKSGNGSENYGDQVSVKTLNNGDRYPLNILEFKKDKGRQHPTQKPVALMEYLIKTYTNEGETVLDFAIGSGTTGVAAKNLSRNFIGIELDENYFKIAAERIEASL